MVGIIVCKDCPKRVLGCHSTCRDYIEDKERYEKAKEKLKEALRGEKEIDNYESKRLNKCRKRYRGNYYGRQ